jgi:hypothetical protein
MNSAVILEEKPGTGTVVMNGKVYWPDAKGNLVPDANVRAQDKLQDESVRKIMGFALALSAQIARFKAHSMADLSSLDAIFEQQYGFVSRGNRGKGNRTYMSFDGCMKVTVQVADFIAFGPELQVAKGLVDECLTDWASDARAELQALVTGAFDVDKEGQISRTRICSLLKLVISDERWLRAMEAVKDAQRVVGRKEYVRFEMRSGPQDGWIAVTIDLANA